MLRYRPAKSFIASLIISVCAALLLPASGDARTVRPVRSHHHCVDSQVTKISEQWAKEWSAKNLNSVVDLYAEDAVFLPSTGSRVTGRPAIRELFAGALAAHTSQIQVRSKVSEQSGNLAFDSGEYEETSTAGGVTRTGRGNYLVVLRREGNRWRIVQHMWTDLPAAAQ